MVGIAATIRCVVRHLAVRRGDIEVHGRTRVCRRSRGAERFLLREAHVGLPTMHLEKASTTRFEKPHSLSYHATSPSPCAPSMTSVRRIEHAARRVADDVVRGRSDLRSTGVRPWGPFAAVFIAALISSRRFFFSFTTRSTSEPSCTGTRMARPSSLPPLRFGSTFGDRLRGARGRRDHAHRGGTRATQVLVRQVEDLLVVRVRVGSWS